MRTLSALLLFASPLAASNAQWTNNTLLNTSVRSGAGVDAVTPLMTDRFDGSTYVSWFDNQPGGYQLRMQRLDENGYALWGAEGLIVSDHPQNSALFRYDLAVDGSGDAIVAFQDERSGQLDVVVYKVSASGDMLWGADGITLTDAGSVQGLAPVIGVLPNNDVLIAWNANDGASAKWIPYQLISEAGDPQWPSPHQVIGANGFSRPEVVPTLDGFVLFYVEETGSFPFTSNMFAQRFDVTGSALWPTPTQVSTKTIPVFYFPQPVRDGHNGLYVAFNTGNPDNPALGDVYVQRVRANGGTWSAAGTQAITGTTTQRFGGPLTLLNDMMGLMLPVQVTNTAQSAGGWNVQRLDTSGVTQFGPSGDEVVAQSAALPSPDDVTNISDGCIVVYSEGGFGQQQVKAARIGVAGNTVWDLALCTVNSNKDDVGCGRIGNAGQLVTVWQDDRTAAGVYAQNVSLEGDLGTGMAPFAAESTASIRAVVIAPGTVDLFTVGVTEQLGQLRVLDAVGRLVRSLPVNNGHARLTLPTPGVYMAELVTSTKRSTVRFAAP